LTLFGKELKANKWMILGFVDVSFLESIGMIGVKLWTIRIKPEEMDKMYRKWEKQGLI